MFIYIHKIDFSQRHTSKLIRKRLSCYLGMMKENGNDFVKKTYEKRSTTLKFDNDLFECTKACAIKERNNETFNCNKLKKDFE